MSALRLHFLGSPLFQHEGELRPLHAAKAIALIAFLAVNRAPQARERILGLLWGESSEEAARKNLRNTLWAVRKALGEDAIRGDEDRLTLDAETWVDVRVLEDTRGAGQAAEGEAPDELFRGPFLQDFSLADAPDFEIWQVGERERLSQLQAAALAVKVERARKAGDWHAVLRSAERALTLDNLQEPMYLALMQAHARLGERGAALRDYERLASTLQRELEVAPLPESQALRAAILRGEMGEAVKVSAPARGPSRKEGSRVPFFGRAAERFVLDRELMAARGKVTRNGPSPNAPRAARPHAHAVLIAGEVGIGKSRLWEEWSSSLPLEIAEGILEARCLEATQALPFAPIAEMFSSRPSLRRLWAHGSPVSPIWMAEVARLAPEIRAARPDLPPLPVLPLEEARLRLSEALTQFLLALEADPLILFVDDLHWADRATIEWLDYSLHRLADRPALLIGTYRVEEASASLGRLIAGWGREELVTRVGLARLSPDEAAALAATLIADTQAAHQIEMTSAGNPYFLIELGRAEPEGVPQVLSELVRTRLERLPETARQVAQAAAVLDPDFDFATLRRTSGRGEEETLDALDQLLESAVLVEKEGAYEFAHPLVASVVRAGLSGARRAFLHRRAAQALETTFAGRLPLIAGRLAVHYERAGAGAQAARYASLAGEHALSLAAPAEAVGFYRQALRLDPGPAREMELGLALLRSEDLEGAEAAFMAALEGFEKAGDRRNAGRACLKLAETFFPRGQLAEGRQWMARAFGFFDEGQDPESQAMAHFMLGTSQLDSAELLTEATGHLTEATRLASEHGLVDLAARGSFIVGNVLAQQGDLAGARAAFDDSIAFAAAAGDTYQQALAYNNAAYHALLAGDLAAAHEAVERGLETAREQALHLPLQYLYSTQGELALAEKSWKEAGEWFRRGLQEAERNGNKAMTANLHANLGLLAWGQEDLEGAMALLEQARVEAAPLAEPHLQTRIDLGLAELEAARGELDAARGALGRARERLARSGHGLGREQADRLAEQLGGLSPEGKL